MAFFSRSVRLLAYGACLALAACAGDDQDRATFDPSPEAAPTPKVESQPLGPMAGGGTPGTIGTGSVKVALVLPQSASGNGGATAKAMRNAAELALEEFDATDIRLIVKDDGGTAQGARAAAQAAADEDAKLVIGPLFAHTVASAASVTRQKNLPVIAFSTDRNVASRGVYLLSFMPESDVERVVAHAAAQGRKSFAALLPENGYGSVVEGAFQEAVAKAGGRLVGLERYGADQAKKTEAINRLSASLPQADALLLPDAPDEVHTVVGLLATNGVNMKRLQILGTGLWNDPAIGRDASLAGAWYAAPDDRGFRSFSERYKAKFGSDPARTASLAYDATALAAALVKTQGPEALTDETFTKQTGFSGVDGAFRFKADGETERGLAVYQVQAGGAAIVSPAVKSFAGQAQGATEGQ